MKTFRLLLAGVVLASISGVAQAQWTPEAIIGQTPGLPPAATLAAAKNGNDQPAASAAYQVINSFVEKIEALRKQSEQDGGGISAESREKMQTQVMASAEKLFQQMTGKSISDMENMENLSEAEQEAVWKEATEQYLSSMGFANVSLDRETKVDDILAPGTGNTLADFEAINRDIKELKKKNYSEEEMEAYLKQDERIQRLRDSPAGKAAANKAQANTSQSPQISESDVNIIREASEEQEKFTQQMNSIVGVNKKEHDALIGQFAGIRNKYYGTADYQKANEIVNACNSGNITSSEQCKAAYEQQNAIHIACDTECFTLWRDQVTKEQERIKALLADAKRVDALQSEAAQAQAQLLGKSLPGSTLPLSGMTQQMTDAGRNAKAVVDAYLNVTLNVMNYEL
ncbi:MAG: hypothetical protein LBF81_03570 [Prevotellaceae bacterium]|jgi:hypothetical protein|nr:hypothetical protein [Prevotellaceae bacterium]